MDLPNSLDEIRAELAAIHDELLALPPSDYSRRVELADRRNQLRARSRELAEALDSPARETLIAEFERLSRLRDWILDQRLSPASESIGDAGISSLVSEAINTAIEKGLGLDEVESQIRTVLDRLRRP